MKNLITPAKWYFIVSTVVLMAGGRGVYADVLGRFPLCEASSALLVKCPGAQGSCLLVGDNEQPSELYLFPVAGGKIDAGAQRNMDLNLSSDSELSDIEALAKISEDRIAAFGSHSRNSRCEKKGKRRQFGKIDLGTQKTVVVSTLRKKDLDCEHLFGKQRLDGAMKAACKAIDEAEKAATHIEDGVKAGALSEDKAKSLCDASGAYNAEGAVAIPTAAGTDVWIGLRSPLLSAHPTHPERGKLAILLHMNDSGAYGFDRVAFLDLGGRGIRDLSFEADSIWVIAGPAEDRSEPFQLRRFAVGDLKKAEIIDTERIQELPPSSEGLAVSGKTAYVVIDGDRGIDESGTCRSPSGYVVVSLP